MLLAKLVIKSVANYSSEIQDWTGLLNRVGEYASGGGSFADVFKGKLKDSPDGDSSPTFTIKVIRPTDYTSDEVRKKAKVSSYLRRDETHSYMWM